MLFLLLSTITSITLYSVPVSLDTCFQKKDQSDVENYRAASILPIFSKFYERFMCDQKYEHFNKILSKQQCGFRQGFSKQYLDEDGVSGALLTDLSKAFDCLSYDLLIAKLAAYGFDHESLTLIQSYLSNRQQSPKVNNTALILTLYSEFLKVQY